MNAEYLKQLARELGCLQTIQIRPANTKRCEQIFDYLIVIDFESTCWDGVEKGLKLPEVIEFPAVLMNTKTGDVESEFQQYVMPMENPRLSDFCKTLTGISQEQVDNGVPLAPCLRLFSRWINDLSGEKTLIFHKNEASHKSCTFVTWSDWDLSTCLDKECQRKNIVKPEILNQWIDLRAVYRAFYKRMPKGLKGAMSELGLQFEGREHSGLCDARNTARLAYSMMKGGVTLSITKKLQQKSPVKKVRKSITPKKSPARKKSLLSSKKSPAITTKCINQNNLDTPVSTGRMERAFLIIPILIGATAWLYFLTCMAPQIGNEDKQSHQLTFPSSFEELKNLSKELNMYQENNKLYVVLLFSSAYLYKQAFSIPGSVLLNVLGGALFGTLLAFPLCCFLTAVGASCSYLMSKYLGGYLLMRYCPQKVQFLQEKIDMNASCLIYYLLFLRLFPMTPNWLINLASPIIGVPLPLFSFSVFVGLMPYNFLCIQAGEMISSLTSLDNLFSAATLVRLALMASMALVPPVVLRFTSKQDQAKAKQY